MNCSWQLVAFDADDTLWDCQSYFEQVENLLYSLIAPYCDEPAKELFRTESANMADLGYGCKAFTLSVIETALRIGGERLTVKDYRTLLDQGKKLLKLSATPLPGVQTTLSSLREELPDDVRMVVFTKGELQDQENKLKRSGLLKYFDDVEIVSNKTQREFLLLSERFGVHPSQMVMVGNSLKSDIAPALAIGAWAVHIPFHVTWQLERAEEIEHPRLIKIENFAQLYDVLISSLKPCL